MESIDLLSIGKRRTQLLPHHRLDLLYEDNNICGARQAVLARDGVVHSSPSKCSRKPDSMCPMCLVSREALTGIEGACLLVLLVLLVLLLLLLLLLPMTRGAVVVCGKVWKTEERCH